jgi:FixJ family two-component response regulator
MESVGMSANLLISIVDDDESARDAVVGLVRALGFTAAEFQSATDFLKSSHLLQTACLITDMRMPGMTGLELYRHLIAVGTPIPTVLVTAYPDEAVRARALKAGIRCYLAKPLEPDALLGCIRSALANPTGGAE